MNRPTDRIANSASLPLRTRGTWWKTYRWPVVVLTLFGMLLAGTIYLQASQVVGVELNARNWALRQFSFRRDPFTGTQLTGIRYEPTRQYATTWGSTTGIGFSSLQSTIAVHLDEASTKDRWDLVSLADSGLPEEGRASILVELLDVRSPSGNNYWATWTNDHPTKAKLFWPAVHHRVAANAYAEVPAVFELAIAEATEDDDNFTHRLNAQMLNSLSNQAELLLEVGSEPEAKRAAQLGLRYGDNEELQRIVSP